MSAPNALPLEAVVLADLAIVLTVGAALVHLVRRLRQPPVVVEIAAGLMLGPSLLGLLPGDLPARLFPLEARPALSVLAQLGLALFMFLAGWELDPRRLRGRGRSVGTIAALAMAVPFALGGGAAALLHASQAPKGVSLGMFVLFMATAFSITAFPVLARIIRDRGLARTHVGVLAMACAAAGDVVAWCVLVLVVALAGAHGPGGFATVIALTLAYAAAMILVVRPVLRRLLRDSARGESRGTALVLIVSGVLLSSYVTSWIGVHTIFGAFAFGLVMPRGDRGLEERIAEPLERTASLLLPVFFTLTGLSVDIRGLGWSGLGVLAFVLVTAVVSKFAGAAVPARLTGSDWREAGVFGALMNTRGLTEIVILGIGLHLGLIGPQLFTIMVLMALITTAMAGPLLSLFGGDIAKGQNHGSRPPLRIPEAPRRLRDDHSGVPSRADRG
ncbi:cation:proton antiporter [Streptomyces sp. NBC_01136]|uniref:cation:proton antiporter n=1 Tax=Streptomyces sp. NBC_01136 TaxID=2903754 RepID=UPI00386FC73B|nr:cation:proton antiporter [Streptomyces sp. NBC_01136]